MAFSGSDWTVTRDTKIISYIGDDHDGASPSYSTVIDFHRWLQDLADDAVASGDDELDITNVDPSRRSTDNIITLINGYSIGATEAEHLYDGSIIQKGGDDIYDGIVNFGNSDVQIQIIQSGTVLSDDWWNWNDTGLNADATSGISHRFMIMTRISGADIDNRKIIGTARRFNYTYSEFIINATARGNNVLALTDALDVNNETTGSSVSGWWNITNNNEGYSGIDVDNNSVNEYYYSEWDRDTRTINEFYERMKWLTRDGSEETLYDLNGELFRGITHQVAITQDGGTFVEPEKVTWGTGATYGEGQLLAIDNTTAGTKLWMQLLIGVVPSAGTGISGSTGRATPGTVTERTISKPFCGASTGAAIIGSYGFGIEVLDLTSNDKVTDLSGNIVTPPNYVVNTVSGLVSGSDRVLVAPWDGSTLDINGDPAIVKGQFKLSGSLTSDNIVSFKIHSGTIYPDTPSSGYVRVTDDNGFERRLHYSAWSGDTFTVDTTDGNEDFAGTNATDGNNVYLSYIDEVAYTGSLSYTSVQSGSRDLVVIVRDGGATPIKQFISAWSQTTSAQTITAIRTSDE